MKPYIKDIDFILGRQRGNSGGCSCVGYDGKLYFHMTRKIERCSFERAFLSCLKTIGVKADTSSTVLA